MTTGDKIVISTAVIAALIAAGIGISNAMEIAKFNNSLSSKCQILLEEQSYDYLKECN